MAKKINHILSYPSTAQEKVKLAQLEARQMTWEKAAQKTLHVYNQLIN